jgi:hypothetical protein
MNTVLLLLYTLFSVSSFFGILWGADPYESSFLIRMLFFVTLFFSLIGIFSLAGIWFSRKKRGILEEHEKLSVFGIAFRRGILLAGLAVAMIALEAGSILNIGNALAIFLLVVSVEMLFAYRRA